MKNSKETVKAVGRDFGGKKGREVRVIGPDLIEEYLTIYLNAYPAYKDLSPEGIDKIRRKYISSMENDENITFVGLFENGRFIALMKIIDFSMNAFGKMCHATGLMSLAVHPMHKKKGAGLDMCAFSRNIQRPPERSQLCFFLSGLIFTGTWATATAAKWKNTVYPLLLFQNARILPA